MLNTGVITPGADGVGRREISPRMARNLKLRNHSGIFHLIFSSLQPWPEPRFSRPSREHHMTKEEPPGRTGPWPVLFPVVSPGAPVPQEVLGDICGMSGQVKGSSCSESRWLMGSSGKAESQPQEEAPGPARRLGMRPQEAEEGPGWMPPPASRRASAGVC